MGCEVTLAAAPLILRGERQASDLRLQYSPPAPAPLANSTERQRRGLVACRHDSLWGECLSRVMQ